MLTLKHIDNIGNETVFETAEVSRARATDGAMMVYFIAKDRQIVQLHGGGVAYVMNSSGATVAVYDVPDTSVASQAIQGGLSGGAIGASSGLRAA